MNMDKQRYKEFASAHAPSSPCLKNCALAFLVGGAICTLGQALTDVYSSLVAEDTASTLTSLTLILIAVVLTGFGVFDKLAKLGGAGTLVPITGFANSVAAPAIDGRSEGYVLGVGAKVFSVCGPVILYGTAAGCVYGIIYWICGML